MTYKYPVRTPASLPLSVPFTIRPNSLFGVHIKYWVIVGIVAVGLTAFLSFVVPAIVFYLLIPLVPAIVLVIWAVQANRKNSLTLTADAITYVENGVTQVMTFTDLGTVEWGLMFAGRRLYYVLHVKNKAGDIHWQLSVLYFWNTRELRTVYTSVPAQYQGTQDVQPFANNAS